MKLPKWVGDREFLVVSGPRVIAAFYTKEEADSYARKRGLEVKNRRG